MNKALRKIAAFCTAAVLLSTYVPASADVAVSGERDDSEVKIFIDNSFTTPKSLGGEPRISGWDINRIGGTLMGGTGLRLNSTSPILPVEAKRVLEPITYGEVTMDFRVYAGNWMTDASLSLRQGNADGISYGFDKQHFWVKSSNGRQDLILYKTSVWYAVRTVIHMEQKTFDVHIDGKRYAEGLPFDAQFFDNFLFTTGAASVGQIFMNYLRITRGYWVNDTFSMQGGNRLPEQWTLQTFDDESAMSAQGAIADSTTQNKGYIEILSKTGETRLSRYFGEQTRDFTLDFYWLIPKRRKEIATEISGGGRTVLGISADENSFYYTDASGRPVRFYDYKDNIWYNFKADINLSRSTFDLYLNGRNMLKGAPLNPAAVMVDTLTAVGGKSENLFAFDNPMVYPQEHFDNYVPEPQVAQSKGVDIGMQFCPLWWEGYHFGWDWVNDSEYRVPLNGFYDEASPELWDWDIKYMTEHGIDFMWYCWFKPGGEGVPLQPATTQPALYSGYMNAQYSDKLKYAIMFENSWWESGYGTNTAQNLELFLNNVARFWIEWHFKDPRYYTIDGRPLLSFYDPWIYQRYFGDYSAEFVKRLGDMCEAEGIGRPLVMFTPRGFPVNDIATLGGEGIVNYNLGSNWPQAMMNANLKNYETAAKAGIEYVPTITNGFDAYAWELATGAQWSGEDMKWALEKYRDEMMSLPGKLETPVIMLGTWNEYGEGHFLNPSKGYGFDFLDAVREVLTDAGAHEDIVPNQQQKDRFNNNYPWQRKTPLREINVGVEAAAEAYEKYKWDFGDPQNTGWKAETAESEAIENGVWKLTSANNLQIALADSGIDTADVTHIKLRLKNSGTGYSTTVRITTPFEETVNTSHGIHTGMAQYMEDFRDYYIPVGKYPLFWRGVLNSLTLSFGGITAGDVVEIDSIAFMALPLTEELTVNIDGWSTPSDAVMRGGLPMLPLRSVTEKLKARVYWDEESATVSLLSGAVQTSFKPGEQTVICKGVEYNLPGSSELVDATTYVNAEILSLAFSKDVSWNETDKILGLTDNTKEVVLKRPNSERKLLWSHEFESMSGVSNPIGMRSISVAEGILNIVTSTNDPIFYLPVPSVSIADAKMITLGVKSDRAFGTQVFFETVESPGVSEAKSFGVSISARQDITEFEINPTRNAAWTGTLRQLRIDPGSAADISLGIDYIRIYGDYETELSAAELAQRYDSRTVTGDGVMWSFDLNNSRDGWRASKSLANVETRAGWLRAEVIDDKPFIETAGEGLNLDTAEYGAVEICLKNTSGGKTAKLYFTTAQSPDWSEDKSFEISLMENGAAGIAYKVNTSENANWFGKLKALRIVPTDAETGAVSIDYIKMIKQ